MASFIINHYGMHEKVRHRMTSLFSVCPSITCIIGLIVICAWIGTSDMNYPPWPFYRWVIVILSLSLIIWFCFSKKDLFFQRAHVQSTRRSNQEKTRPPTHELQIQSRPTLLLNFHVTSRIHYHRRFINIYGFLRGFFLFQEIIFFKCGKCFKMWERDSASAKIDDCNWWWLIWKTHFRDDTFYDWW